MTLAALITILTLIGVFALLMTAALSPLETLNWWAGWVDKDIEAPAPPQTGGDESAAGYIVYLSGIASITGEFLIPREKAFIKNLRNALPDCQVIDTVFPYSPAGVPLSAAPRMFDDFWRWLQQRKISGRQSMLEILINIRNVFQVMISADHRYGPMFNYGAARSIEAALTNAGWRRDAPAPVVIIGYSGGAQVAIGAAAFLKPRLQCPISIISVGGVMASDPGLNVLDEMHMLVGDKDRVAPVGAITFPERWAIAQYSEWNAAKREHRIRRHPMKNMKHAGPFGYFGLPRVNGVSNNSRTSDKIITILSDYLQSERATT